MSAGTAHRIIAIAVDSSDHSEKAFDWFKEHVYREGDELVIIHSHESYPSAIPDMIATEGWKGDVEKHDKIVKGLEKRYRQKCKELKLEAKIIGKNGPPGQEICKVAAEEEAIFIVMGSRDAGTVRRTILGSVSDYVIHHADVPVMVIPRE